MYAHTLIPSAWCVIMNMRMRLRLRLRVWVWLWVREPIKCGTNMHTETQAETRVWHLVNSLAVCLGQLCMQFGAHPQSQRAAAATIVGKVTPKSHGKMQQKFSGKTKMRKKGNPRFHSALANLLDTNEFISVQSRFGFRFGFVFA